VLMYSHPCSEGKVLKMSLSKLQQNIPAMAYAYHCEVDQSFSHQYQASHKSELMVHIAHGFSGTLKTYICLYLVYIYNAEKISTTHAQR